MSDTCFNSNDNKKSVNKLGGEGEKIDLVCIDIFF